MSNPYCLKHKVSNIKHFRYCKTKKKYLCGLCRAEVMHRNYEKNKDKINERTALYRKNNPDKVRKFKDAENARRREKKRIVIEMMKWDAERIRLYRRLRNVIQKINSVDALYEKYGRFAGNGS